MHDTRGDYDTAVTLHREALAIQLQVHGAQARNTEIANSHENCGNALYHRAVCSTRAHDTDACADLACAQGHLATSVAMRHVGSTSGQGYPYARSLCKLADVLQVRNDLRGARCAYLEALRVLYTMPLSKFTAHKRARIAKALQRLHTAG